MMHGPPNLSLVSPYLQILEGAMGRDGRKGGVEG